MLICQDKRQAFYLWNKKQWLWQCTEWRADLSISPAHIYLVCKYTPCSSNSNWAKTKQNNKKQSVALFTLYCSLACWIHYFKHGKSLRYQLTFLIHMKLLLNASLRNVHKLWQKCSSGSSPMVLNEKDNAKRWLFRLSKKDEQTSTREDPVGYATNFYCNPDVTYFRVWHFMACCLFVFVLAEFISCFITVWAIMFISLMQTKAESFEEEWCFSKGQLSTLKGKSSGHCRLYSCIKEAQQASCAASLHWPANDEEHSSPLEYTQSSSASSWYLLKRDPSHHLYPQPTLCFNKQLQIQIAKKDETTHP